MTASSRLGLNLGAEVLSMKTHAGFRRCRNTLKVATLPRRSSTT